MRIVIGKTKFWCADDLMVVTAKGHGERYWAGISRGDEPNDNVGLLPDACFKLGYVEKYYESGGDFNEDDSMSLLPVPNESEIGNAQAEQDANLSGESATLLCQENPKEYYV